LAKKYGSGILNSGLLDGDLAKVRAAVAGRDASPSPHGWVHGGLSVFG